MNGPFPEISAMPRPYALLLLAGLSAAAISNASAEERHGPHSLPKCAEASNGCSICRFDVTGEPRCSSPGIACQPSVWRCIKPRDGDADSPSARRPDAR